jgi:hypothetical protein
MQLMPASAPCSLIIPANLLYGAHLAALLSALQLLQVAAYLRRTGFFVVAALTRPFEFEGRRKLEEADALIEALQDVAQLVVSAAPAPLCVHHHQS